MDFLYLFIACAFFALQFIFQKLFERRTVGGLSVCLWNQIVCCLVSGTFLFIKTGGAFSSVTATAFLYALLYSVSGIVCSVATISAMSLGKVAALGTYCLAGGMILPFVYGIFALGEEAGLFKWLGMAVLCLSLIPSVMQKDSSTETNSPKNNLRFILYAIIVFVTNGFVSIFSKMHQISPDAMDDDGFVFLALTISCTIAMVIILAIAAWKKSRGEQKVLRAAFWDIGKKPMTAALFAVIFVFAGTYSVCNTLGNLFSLRCMVTMDASIQFPILSAVVIVLTALFGRIFFGEKITKETAISLVLSVTGIGLFIIP